MGKKISEEVSYKVCETNADGKIVAELGNIGGGSAELAVSADVSDGAVIENEPHVFVYLGPTIRGVITNGGIFEGSVQEILKRFEKSIEKYPQIKRLIIADISVAKAREMLAKGEGAISVAYKKLAQSIKKEV